MEILKLNETPKRTSKNFNINNIKLDNVEIPQTISEFKNVNIVSENVKISSKVNKCNLLYGVGSDLVKQVLENSNCNLKLEIEKSQDIKIEFNFDEANKELIDNIEIVGNEGVNATVIIKYNSDENLEAFHNGILKIKAKKNSKLNVVVINLLSNKSNNFISFENEIEENAKVNYTIIDFGAKNSITNLYSNLVGEKAGNNINTIYLGKENQMFDINYIAELRGKRTNVNIEVQGALKDNSKKHFKGTIDFKKGCKKAKGNENEFCTILSDKARSIALPMLLCSEDDVEGNHSSAAGKIGEKELFYIMSRGFELKEAMKLVVRAKFNNIIENIPSEEIKNLILYEIDKRLD